MRQEKSTTMWRLGGLAITLTLLANILSFAIQKLTQYIHWQY